jgi:hypothetical protein
VNEPVLPEKPVEKPSFNQPAGFSIKPGVFQALNIAHTKKHKP